MTDKRNKLFQEINIERNIQNNKFGEQNHHPMEWLSILGEEVGEVNKAVLETYFEYKGSDPLYKEYREELIQVAAVAISMIECFDRNYDELLSVQSKTIKLNPIK
jgi:NTP pyrophosphatase (non-canonical NTP hydrolase)